MPTSHRQITREDTARAVRKAIEREGTRFHLTPGQARAITEGAQRKEPTIPDRFVVRAVVVGLLIVGIAVIVGAVALSFGSHTIPDPLWTIAGTAVGAVAGILSKTNTEPGPVQPVQVMNQPAAPVPVSEPVQPGYQPDPQKDDQAAKAQRLAHAQEVLQNGAMTGRADASVFRSDMHRVARQAADLGHLRPAWVPSPGNPPIG